MKFVYFETILARYNYSLSTVCFTEKTSVRSDAKTSELNSEEFDNLPKHVDNIKALSLRKMMSHE